jgi:hypothetical protein
MTCLGCAITIPVCTYLEWLTQTAGYEFGSIRSATGGRNLSV